MSGQEKTYEEIAEIVREALSSSDWQDLNAAACALLVLEPRPGTIGDGYWDGFNDCKAAMVATLAVHLGIEGEI